MDKNIFGILATVVFLMNSPAKAENSINEQYLLLQNRYRDVHTVGMSQYYVAIKKIENEILYLTIKQAVVDALKESK